MSNVGRITRFAAAVVGLAAGLVGVAAATAAEPLPVLLAGSGLTAPAAVAKDSDGGIWVADHLMGLCKVDRAAGGAPGALIEGPSCNLDPTLRVGPVEVAGVVYDGAEKAFYVGGASDAGGGIWRLGWDSGTKQIQTALNKTFQILGLPAAGEIVFGMGFDPSHLGGPVLDFTTKRTNSVFRLQDPANCPDVALNAITCTQSGRLGPIGNAAVAGGGPVAHLNGFVYLGEDVGVSRFPSPAALPAAVQNAQPVEGSPPFIISSLASDPAVDGGRLYAGTFDVNPSDTVYAMGNGGTGPALPYATQLAGISSLGIDSNGTLLIGDDPGLVSGVEGTGRVFSLGLTSLQIPQVTITGAPPASTNAQNVTVSYSSRPGVLFECRFDPPLGSQAGWEPCGTGPGGSRDYTGLTEGPHRVEVRAVDSAVDPAVGGVIGPGPRVAVPFTVDRTAPVARIDNGAGDHSAPSGTLVMRFSADDATAGFQCSLSGLPWATCSSGHTLSGLTGADYLFHVRAVDGAGNIGPAASWDFVVDPSKRPRLRTSKVTTRARGPVTARARIAGRRLVVSIPAPAGARFARIAIERKGVVGANGLPSRPTVLEVRSVALIPGRLNVVRWTPRVDKLGRVVNLRSIRVMVRVGPARRTLGPARAAALSTKARFWRLAPSTRPTLQKERSL